MATTVQVLRNPLAAILIALIAADGAVAETKTWLAGTGSWFSNFAWSPPGVPDFATSAYINNGGRAQILNPGAEAESIELGDLVSDNGALEVRGGELSLKLTGGGLLRVGRFGDGELFVLDGGTISSRNGQIATQSLSTGAATVAGLDASWSNHEQLHVGISGTATVQIQRGGNVSNTINEGSPVLDTSAYIGFDTDGEGSVYVDGADSKLINGYDLVVGERGTGTLAITDGGFAENFNGNIGVHSESSGGVTVSGADSRWENHSVVAVGVSGTGTLNVLNRGLVTSTNGRIAREADSVGTVTVNGLGSIWSATGDMSVGNAGSGSLTIENGGYVSNVNGNIGVLAGSTGNVVVRGSFWSNSGVVAVGVFGNGTLAVTNGGRVESTNGRIAREAGSTGDVLVDGPGSEWHCTGDLTMGLSLTGNATLAVTNGGVVSVVGQMTVGPGGSLNGDGTIVGLILNEGHVAPGASPGTLHINGTYLQSTSGTLDIELASATSFDRLVANNLSLAGRLNVTLQGGYVPHGTHSFDILDWGGTLSGEFSSIELPTLDGALTWDTSQLYTTGVLTVTGEGVDGDFNNDGVVNAGDYVVLRKNDGTQPAYDTWRANFGSTISNASSTNTTAPEPANVMMLLAGALAMLTRNCRRVP